MAILRTRKQLRRERDKQVALKDSHCLQNQPGVSLCALEELECGEDVTRLVDSLVGTF